jgi:hypothetical protein
VPPVALDDAGAELLLEELVTAGFVEVTRVDDGVTIKDMGDLTTGAKLVDGLIVFEAFTRVQCLILVDSLVLVEALVVFEALTLDDETTATLVALVALTTDKDDDTLVPALVELATTELFFKLVDAFTVEVATADLTVDFVDALVVGAGTEEDDILAPALVDKGVPLTSFGEARDQNTAGV